jgi:hypothetical protein
MVSAPRCLDGAKHRAPRSERGLVILPGPVSFASSLTQHAWVTWSRAAAETAWNTDWSSEIRFPAAHLDPLYGFDSIGGLRKLQPGAMCIRMCPPISRELQALRVASPVLQTMRQETQAARTAPIGEHTGQRTPERFSANGAARAAAIQPREILALSIPEACQSHGVSRAHFCSWSNNVSLPQFNTPAHAHAQSPRGCRLS